MHHYLLIDCSTEIKNVLYLEDFFDDYTYYYPPSIYSNLEMIFCDLIYQMILESHLIRANYTTRTKTVVNREKESLNAATMTYEKVEESITKINVRHHEYATEDFYESCRNMAKDFLFSLKKHQITPDYLIKKLKESEKEEEYNRNILPFEENYYKFSVYLDYPVSNTKVICSEKDISEFMKRKGIKFIEF